MDINHELLDELRRGRRPLQGHVIDEFVTGNLSRRSFVQRAALIGLAMPTIGGILSACSPSDSPGTGNAQGRTGATIKVGIPAPTAAPNPLLLNDSGLQLLGQVGQALVYFDDDNVAQPWLATSWSANDDGSVWTFKIRQGVSFSDGTPMTVDDVVYTYRSHADPKNSGNALSVFASTLDPDGVVKVDDETVAFNLKASSGSFPASVSQYNYNAIVVPKDTDFTQWSRDFIGTGPFKMQTFDQQRGATFERNPHFWGDTPAPAALEYGFYDGEQSMTAALQARDLDCISQFTLSNSPQLLGGGFTVVRVSGSAHRACSLRNDSTQFADKRVRQAVALTLDREAIRTALFKEYAELGNDSPFAPSYPMTDSGVPQRDQDLVKAKDLLAQAGVPRGFSVPLYTQDLQELPQLAQVIKDSAAKIGVDITLNVDTVAGYYGDAQFGKSNWLDGEMSLVDYGGRPVPDVFLQAPLQTTDSDTKQGSWNAAHFSNATYDSLSKQFVAAVDLSAQRKLATRIQTLLLDETPVIVPYFFDLLAASQTNVFDIHPHPSKVLYLDRTTKS